MPPTQSTSDQASETTKSGIATSATGSRVIPSSTRADGSTRREIKIRPGYRPPEDVEVYKNRTAEAWRERGTGGVPGAESVNDDQGQDSKSAASNKNAKRREARKRAKAAETGGEAHDTEQKPRATTIETPNAEANAPDDTIQKDEGPAQADQDKKIKRLKKKLREARELQAKKEQGEGLLQEQFEKVIKIRELMRELEKLGVSDDGEGAIYDHADAANDFKAKG